MGQEASDFNDWSIGEDRRAADLHSHRLPMDVDVPKRARIARIGDQ